MDHTGDKNQYILITDARLIYIFITKSILSILFIIMFLVFNTTCNCITTSIFIATHFCLITIISYICLTDPEVIESIISNKDYHHYDSINIRYNIVVYTISILYMIIGLLTIYPTISIILIGFYELIVCCIFSYMEYHSFQKLVKHE